MHAGFARPRDLARLRVRRPTPGRLTLGHLGRHLLAAEEQTSLAVVGPTGCGKTAGFAIPALLEWTGPIIATSVKADLIDAAVEHRRHAGRVWIYDPTGASGHPGDRWSPLAACTTWAGALRIAAWLCEAAQPRNDSVTDGDYWYTQARRALAPYLYAAAVDGRTMQDVITWVDSREIDDIECILRRHAGIDVTVDDLLTSDAATARRNVLRGIVEPEEVAYVRQQMAALGGGGSRSWEAQPVARWPADQQTQLAERVEAEVERRLRTELEQQALHQRRSGGQLNPLHAAQALWSKEPRIRDSVLSTIENVLAGYGDPGVLDAADDCDLDLTDWLSGNNTIFVVAPAHEQARLRPVLTVLVQQAIRAAYEHANANRGTLEHPCLVLLDEAGNIAPLRDLPSYASTARSHGITFVSIWQDLAQIKAIYGDRARTVLNNHRAKLFGSGIADDDTLEYLSKLIGDQRRTEINLSGDLHSGRRSISEHATYRRAAPADLLRRVQPNEAVLVYGSQLPAHIRLRPWWQTQRRRRSPARGPAPGGVSDAISPGARSARRLRSR
ncbi:MAG: type IV secretory system conjugative DNA transfer family protein [Acidimicrobiales bacterium]|jgi:type IV secretion system protein VirD4|nr:type IV secretory system conjugative DNA transfer family protein [Acidimicrobiales bacterium]